jgi:4-aminobutyrate aminotransferase/(S)-3-amino-2-methylpropionate transaminase
MSAISDAVRLTEPQVTASKESDASLSLQASLAHRRERAVPRGVATATPVFAMKAENAWIQGVDGRTYIDFAGGIGTLATGHRHPGVINAVKSI